MTQKIRVDLVCDACNEERSAERTVTFSFDDEKGSHEYLMELCSEHLTEFARSLDPWVSLGRPVSVARTSRPPKATTTGMTAPARQPARRDPEQLAGIRTWARANGFVVGDKGRIPAEIEEAYNRRQPAEQ